MYTYLYSPVLCYDKNKVFSSINFHTVFEKEKKWASHLLRPLYCICVVRKTEKYFTEQTLKILYTWNISCDQYELYINNISLRRTKVVGIDLKNQL